MEGGGRASNRSICGLTINDHELCSDGRFSVFLSTSTLVAALAVSGAALAPHHGVPSARMDVAVSRHAHAVTLVALSPVDELWSARIVAHSTVASFVVLLLDIILTLGQEIEYIWRCATVGPFNISYSRA